MTRDSLSIAEARRIALAAQGFGPRRAKRIDRRHLRAILERIGLVQIDSVNVLVRSHYLPFHARLGPYATAALDAMAYRARRELFEYWGHEASLMPLALQPLLRWRMADARAGRGLYGGLARFAAERRLYIDEVHREMRERGPLRASELGNGGVSKGGWWGWSDGKRALEWLFWAGLVTTTTRRHFERVYDITERALPPAILDTPTPTRAEAQRRLLAIASQALGIATEPDLRDYFRLPVADSKARLDELVEQGVLRPVTVEGWSQPAYLHGGARLPARLSARALLSPFDSLVWERARCERLFGFRYRLELYTPGHKRQFGYYVLPFLLGTRLVARVDLKADRAGGALLVQAAHGEPGIDRTQVAADLAQELATLAAWLELERIALTPSGDLAAALAALGLPDGRFR